MMSASVQDTQKTPTKTPVTVPPTTAKQGVVAAVDQEKKKKKERPGDMYLSNDGFLWTDNDADLKLIEPRILVSANFNYLEFARKAERPAECRTVCLVNHGDHPVAFQVHITDNYSYFVDRKHGVIPPRQASANVVVRMANVALVNVFHRPHNEYNEQDRAGFYNVPHKDKMFIHLAPQMCQTFSPAAIFHNERCYEKLRIMLRYSGIELKDNDTRPKQLLITAAPGWATWKAEVQRKPKLNAKQLAAYRRIEKRIIQNASKELIVDDPQKVLAVKPKRMATPAKHKTPAKTTPTMAAGFMNMITKMNPFKHDRDKEKEKEEAPKAVTVTRTVIPLEPAPSPVKVAQQPAQKGKQHHESQSPNFKDKNLDAGSAAGNKMSKMLEAPTPRDGRKKDKNADAQTVNRMSKLMNVEVVTPKAQKKDKTVDASTVHRMSKLMNVEVVTPKGQKKDKTTEAAGSVARMSKMANVEMATPREARKKDKTLEQPLPQDIKGVSELRTVEAPTPRRSKEKKDKSNEPPSPSPAMARKMKMGNVEAPTPRELRRSREQNLKNMETPSPVIKKGKGQSVEAPSPRDKPKSKEHNKNVEPPSPRNKKTKTMSVEAPSPRENRKSKEQKDRNNDVESPAMNKKSRERSADQASPERAKHDKSPTNSQVNTVTHTVMSKSKRD